jgi:hypothetical protein
VERKDGVGHGAEAIGAELGNVKSDQETRPTGLGPHTYSSSTRDTALGRTFQICLIARYDKFTMTSWSSSTASPEPSSPRHSNTVTRAAIQRLKLKLFVANNRFHGRWPLLMLS